MVKWTRKRIALSVSLLVHALLLVVLCLWYLPGVDKGKHVGPPTKATDIADDDRAAKEANRQELRQLADEPAEVSDQDLRRSVQSQIEQAGKLPDERKLSELESNLKRLDSIADQDSVREVSSAIANSFGLDSEQYQVKPLPADGEFDTESAQISDVNRTRDQEGRWKYELVMVDAEGRQTRVAMGEEEGASLHETFELMKRYPLAHNVYRSVVMPMMQKMLEAETTVGPESE